MPDARRLRLDAGRDGDLREPGPDRSGRRAGTASPTSGLTTVENVPSAPTIRSPPGAQSFPGALRLERDGVGSLRKPAQRQTAPPYVTVFAAGRSGEERTVNHVDRSSSSARNCAPVTVAWTPPAPTAVTRVARPDGAVDRRQVGERAGQLQLRRDLGAVDSTGPQSWYGEMLSYGSATETRYGTASPVASSDDAVRPPELEKKSVSATLPL